MVLAMTKNKLSNYLVYAWPKFLIVGIMAILIWGWATNMLIRPHENERINIFIGTNQLDTDEIYQRLITLDLKEVNLSYHDPESEMFKMILSSRGTVDTDLVILDLSTFNNQEVVLWFKDIDIDYLASLVGEHQEYFELHGKVYGVKLVDNIYIFLNKQSNNLGKMNASGKDDDDLALKALKLIKEMGPR